MVVVPPDVTWKLPAEWRGLLRSHLADDGSTHWHLAREDVMLPQVAHEPIA